jgi:hypothetical protein
MLILGLLLVLLSAAAVALLVAYNSSGGPEQMIVLFGRDWVNVTPLQAFIAGIVVALVFCLGLWMVVSTERRRRATASEYRAVRREARTARAERDRLAKQLEQERTAEPAPAANERAAAEQRPVAERGSMGETTETRGFGIGRHFRRHPRADRAADEQTTTNR